MGDDNSTPEPWWFIFFYIGLTAPIWGTIAMFAYWAVTGRMP